MQPNPELLLDDVCSLIVSPLLGDDQRLLEEEYPPPFKHRPLALLNVKHILNKIQHMLIIIYKDLCIAFQYYCSLIFHLLTTELIKLYIHVELYNTHTVHIATSMLLDS